MAITSNATYQSSQNTDTTRTLTTVIRKHIREEEVDVLRNHQLTAKLEADGRISTNMGGAGFDWPIRYRLHEVQDNNGTDPRNFVAQEMWKIANLEYRGYQVTDAISKKEKLAAQGREGIIKVASTMVERLMTSLKETFARELYIDGNASGNGKKMHGIESMMAERRDSGPISQSINRTTTGSSLADRDVNAADPAMWPEDEYAGLSTDLGDYGGAQLSGSWPDGSADPQFDFFTPLLVNTNSTFFSASSPGWASNAKDILSWGIIHAQRNARLDDQLDIVMLDRTLYYQARALLTDAERIQVTNKTGLRSFGFKNVFEIDGTEITWEYGVPMTTTYRTSGVATSVETGYGFNTSNMHLYSMQDGLFKSEGPEHDIDSQYDKVVVDFLGNLKFASPRRFVKWAAYSA